MVLFTKEKLFTETGSWFGTQHLASHPAASLPYCSAAGGG